MFCVKCGTPLPDDALFCTTCGSSTGAEPQHNPRPQQNPQPQHTPQQPAYQPQPQHTPQQPVYQPQPQYAPQQPVYQQSAQPAYQQPVYQQPAQPAYQQPVYQQPMQPVYQQPVYQGAMQPVAAAVGTAAKAANGGRIIAWILAAAVLIGAAVFAILYLDLDNLFKSDETLIRERIQALEDAYNAGDWDGILECLDGPTQAMMEMTMGFADGLMSGLGGIDISITDMYAFGSLFMPSDAVKIEVTNIVINGDYATVTVNMSVNMYEMSQTEAAELPMVKIDGDWYIGGLEGMLGDLLMP